MGAIDPSIARKQVKINSSVVLNARDERQVQALNLNEAGLRSPTASPIAILTTDANQFDYSGDKIARLQMESKSTSKLDSQFEQQQQPTPKLRNNSSFHIKARKFLTLSPSSGLKPSSSTSCLNLADADTDTTTSITPTSEQDNGNTSNATRASMTHEWKKLKTPNKCRECNLLVYFNGRECSFCGFVAHKKCVTVLVIKCRGQALSGGSSSMYNPKYRKGQQSRSSQSAESILSQQQQLSVTSHYQQLLLQSPRKSKTNIQPVFGQPVNTDGRQVIDLVRRFIYEIDTRGLTLKGIYRVSSIKSKVDKLCNYYDQNLSSLVDLSSFHPNIIANALKMYLRQLPEPLLTQELYNKFIDVAKKYPNSPTSTAPSSGEQTNLKLQSPSSAASAYIQRQRKPYIFPFSTTAIVYSGTTSNIDPAYDPLLIVELKEIIEQLPPINRELIAILMRHLRRVADMSCENQMSAKNLSIIFGPTLLSADNKSLAIVDNIHQARVVELMITWAEQIFPQYANYESRAVIELDLSALPDEPETIDKQEKVMKAQQKLSDNRCKTSNLTSSNTNKLIIVDPKTRLSRPSIPSESGRVCYGSNVYEINLPQPTKTRNDLKELRRQFFTVPTTQVTYSNSANLSQSEANPNEEPKNTRSINPPGSVPVI